MEKLLIILLKAIPAWMCIIIKHIISFNISTQTTAVEMRYKLELWFFFEFDDNLEYLDTRTKHVAWIVNKNRLMYFFKLLLELFCILKLYNLMEIYSITSEKSVYKTIKMSKDYNNSKLEWELLQ